MRSLLAQTRLILRNDLRLLWRDIRHRLTGAGVSPWRGRIGVTVLAVLLVFFQTILILGFRAYHRPFPLHAESAFWLIVAFLMLTSAVSYTVTVLFERADFDLLLSAPVSPAAILLARMTGMTFAAAIGVATFVFPLITAAVIGISSRYAIAYLLWFLLALLVTCCGVWVTLILVRWLGPRRARIWSQVVAALLGASIYITFQSQNALSAEARAAMTKRMIGFFAHPLVLSLPRAGRGDPIPLTAMLVIAFAATTLTIRLLARTFVGGIQQASESATRSHRRTPRPFVDGLVRATFWKDVRLIVRDPLLLSRVLPSVFYLVPILFPMQRLGGGGIPRLVASFAVLASLMVSSQLTAVAAAGEEGWDLIRLSPASTTTIRLAKIGAGMALPLGLTLIATITVAIMGRPLLAIVTLLTAVISCAASCWIEVATMQPTPRNDLIRRNGRVRRPFTVSRLLASIAFLGFGTATTLLAGNDLWWWASVTFGTVVICAIGCFTLVEMRDVEFETASPRPTHDTAPV